MRFPIKIFLIDSLNLLNRNKEKNPHQSVISAHESCNVSSYVTLILVILFITWSTAARKILLLGTETNTIENRDRTVRSLTIEKRKNVLRRMWKYLIATKVMVNDGHSLKGYDEIVDRMHVQNDGCIPYRNTNSFLVLQGIILAPGANRRPVIHVFGPVSPGC